jgi:hypothetical protein
MVCGGSSPPLENAPAGGVCAGERQGCGSRLSIGGGSTLAKKGDLKERRQEITGAAALSVEEEGPFSALTGFYETGFFMYGVYLTDENWFFYLPRFSDHRDLKPYY